MRRVEGTSYAAINVMAAALLVWTTDPNLTANEVARVLKETAQPLFGADEHERVGPRRLDLDAALHRVRADMVQRVLAGGELDIEQILATCGLRTAVAVRLIDRMFQAGDLVRVPGSGERYALSERAAAGRRPFTGRDLNAALEELGWSPHEDSSEEDVFTQYVKPDVEGEVYLDLSTPQVYADDRLLNVIAATMVDRSIVGRERRQAIEERKLQLRMALERQRDRSENPE